MSKKSKEVKFPVDMWASTSHTKTIDPKSKMKEKQLKANEEMKRIITREVWADEHKPLCDKHIKPSEDGTTQYVQSVTSPDINCSCGREWRYGEPTIRTVMRDYGCQRGMTIIRFCPSCKIYEEIELKQKTV